MDSRSRLSVDGWDTAISDVISRLMQIGQLVAGEDNSEINRHIPVSLVAALQTYFRYTIVSICNLNDSYRERGAELVQEKFSAKDALGWIGGGAVSFGELVGHSMSCNSVTDYIAPLEKLLGVDFRKALSEAVSPHDIRNSKPDPALLVEDVGLLLSRIGDLFKIRHILAHEAASPLVLKRSTVTEMYKAVKLLVEATEAVLWVTAYSDLPLTQSEMRIHAYKRVEEEERLMEAALSKILKGTRDEEFAKWIRSNQDEWSRVFNEWFDKTIGGLNGTMWPSVRANAYAEAIKARTSQLIQWIAIEQLDDDDERTQRVMKKFTESMFDY
ncbi:lysozyme inhibitor LprI family protein [Burkholderia cepacia]|uniref:lysozyme inhibitor LprI family protein n=1 Tax=Burkholderia cepacia TaxID=292 RepID=UPI0012D88463|nr:lysozyme inhibitor LprI family protein [Burkholderia cepacia]